MKTSCVTSSAVACVPAHVQRKPVNGPLVPLIERGKRRLISFAKLPQQLLIFELAILPWLCWALPSLLLSIARIGQIVPLFFSAS